MQILVELGITHVRTVHKRGLLRPVDRQGKQLLNNLKLTPPLRINHNKIPPSYSQTRMVSVNINIAVIEGYIRETITKKVKLYTYHTISYF